MKRKKRAKKLDYTKVVLQIIYASGVISMAVLAPNALQSLAMFSNRKNTSWQNSYIRRVVSRLEQEGYVVFKNTQKGKFLRLTDKGRRRIKQYELGTYAIPIPRRWDGKFRMIIFDIKERRRDVRNKLRSYLERFGLVRLQNSVWVYPYPCAEVVVLLKASFKIGKDILYVEIESLENDQWLRRHFRLSG